MTQKRILMIREFLAATTNHWTFFPIVFLFAAISEMSGMALLGWILAGLAPFFLSFLRNYMQSILLQIMCYPIFMGILTLIPIEPEILKGIYFFFVTIYLLLSLFQTITNKGQMTKILPPFFTIGINLFAALIIFPHREVYHYPFFLLLGMVITAVSFFLAFYVDQYLLFVTKNEETSSSMPKQKIFRSGILYSFYYLGVGAGILLLISSFGISDEFLNGFWGKVKQAFRKFIQFLVNLFTKGERKVPISDGMHDPIAGTPDLTPAKTSLFWKLMEILLFFAVVMLILFVIAFLIFKFLRLLARLRPRKTLVEAEEEVEEIDVHENIGAKRKFFFDWEEDESLLSPRQRIRRIFRKRAQALERPHEELPYLTPGDVAEAEDNPLLASLYEKARYSQLPCEKEDVKALMRSLRSR